MLVTKVALVVVCKQTTYIRWQTRG